MDFCPLIYINVCYVQGTAEHHLEDGNLPHRQLTRLLELSNKQVGTSKILKF